MKRIIFTVTNDLSYDQRMQRISRTLVEAGYKVKLVGFKKSGSIPLKEETFEQKRFNMLFKKGKLFYLAYNFRLFWYLLFQKVDILVGIDLDTIISHVVVGKLRRKTIGYDAHEYFTELPEVVGRGYVGPVWRFIERFAVPKTDFRITVTQGLVDILSEKYNKPFNLVRNMPILKNMVAGEQSDPYMIYQGFLNKGRGLETIIDVMQEVDMRLVIAGDGDISQELKDLAKTKGVEDRIEFLGFVGPDELKTLTSGAILGINLLENLGLSYYHSLGNKFFDYVQAGVPQLAMNFPEYANLNKEHEVAMLLPDLDKFTVLQAIKFLLGNKGEYERLKENCLAAREKWTWEGEAKRLVEIYDGLST